MTSVKFATSLTRLLEGRSDLDRAWFERFLGEVEARLAPLESDRADVDALYEQMRVLVLGRINDVLIPELETAQELRAGLQGALEAFASDAAAALAALAAGQISGANVSVDVDGIAATDAEAALVEVLASATAKADAAVAAANHISARTLFAGAM